MELEPRLARHLGLLGAPEGLGFQLPCFLAGKAVLWMTASKEDPPSMLESEQGQRCLFTCSRSCYVFCDGNHSSNCPSYPILVSHSTKISINTIVNDPPIPNYVSGINKERIENTSIINEDNNKGEVRDVDDFDSLDINFHDTNKTNMFSPPGKTPKIADIYNTSLRQKG